MILMVNRHAQWFFCWCLFFCGAITYLGSTFDSSIFSPSIFGDLAHQTKATTWALGFMAGSGLVCYGIHINGRWRYSPGLRIAGYLFLLFLHSTLAYSAFFASEGFIVFLYTTGLLLPHLFSYLWINIKDLQVRLQNGRV